MDKLLTGIRPTGPLHLGHYVGALQQWIPLQEDYECFFLIADVQALTTHMEQPDLIQRSVRDVVLDWLSVGLDPSKDNVNFVLQSAIPELTELTAYLSMVTPFTWMERNPTIRAEKKRLGKKVTAGFMTYVISQAADILFVSPDPDVSRTTILVPVGDDQVPHLQDTNKIAKAFNNQYGDTLVTCDSLVGDVGRLVGTDGQDKMSKSLGNTIFLSDDTATVEKQVMGMFTDPERIRADIPGTVKGNPVFIYHDAFNPDVEEVKDLKARYKQGKVGDVEVKEKLIVALENFLGPIRAKRHLAESVNVIGILSDGTGKARELAIQTVARVKKSMGLVRLEG